MGRLQLGFHSGWISVNFHLLVIVLFCRNSGLVQYCYPSEGRRGRDVKDEIFGSCDRYLPPLFHTISFGMSLGEDVVGFRSGADLS